MAGLLLRSSLVSGWPGLDVRAYGATVAGSNPLRADLSTLIAPLRLDRLAPDVLLPASAEATPVTYADPATGKQYLAVVATGGGLIGAKAESDVVVAFALP